jgi:hypothetical protein
LPRGHKKDFATAIEEAYEHISGDAKLVQGIKRKSPTTQEDSSASEVSRSPSPPLCENKKAKQFDRVNRPR